MADAHLSGESVEIDLSLTTPDDQSDQSLLDAAQSAGTTGVFVQVDDEIHQYNECRVTWQFATRTPRHIGIDHQIREEPAFDIIVTFERPYEEVEWLERIEMPATVETAVVTDTHVDTFEAIPEYDLVAIESGERVDASVTLNGPSVERHALSKDQVVQSDTNTI